MKSFAETTTTMTRTTMTMTKLLLLLGYCSCLLARFVGSQPVVIDYDEDIILEIATETDGIKVVYRCLCDIETYDSFEFNSRLPEGFTKGARSRLLTTSEFVIASIPPPPIDPNDEPYPIVIDVNGTPCRYISTISYASFMNIPETDTLIGFPVQRRTIQTFPAGSLVHLLTSQTGDVVLILGGIVTSAPDNIFDDDVDEYEIGVVLDDYVFPSYLTYITRVLSTDLVKDSNGMAQTLIGEGMIWERIDVDVDAL